jgi:hypothetical protein
VVHRCGAFHLLPHRMPLPRSSAPSHLLCRSVSHISCALSARPPPPSLHHPFSLPPLLWLRSNAGKFTTDGTVTVEMVLVTTAVMESSPGPRAVRASGPGARSLGGDSAQFVVLLVTNPRFGPPLANPEALFVPFKGSADAAGSNPGVAGAVFVRALFDCFGSCYPRRLAMRLVPCMEFTCRVRPAPHS